jgi:hypothetical protein
VPEKPFQSAISREALQAIFESFARMRSACIEAGEMAIASQEAVSTSKALLHEVDKILARR